MMEGADAWGKAAGNGQRGRRAGFERTILESLADAVVVADGTNRVVYANPAAASLVGEPVADLVGSSVFRLIGEQYVDAHAEAFSRHLSLQGEAFAGRVVTGVLRRHDGSEVPVDVVLSDLDTVSGAFVVAVLHDRRDRLDVERWGHIATQLLAVLSREQGEEEAIAGLLATLGQSLHWDVTALWSFHEAEGLLRCQHVWRAGDEFAVFDRYTRQYVFAAGEVLPGRVLVTGAPAWITDIAQDEEFLRKEVALGAGLRSAFAFPVRAGGRVIAVVELLSTEHRQLDSALVDDMRGAGSQLGAYLSHVRAEHERDRLLVDLEGARQSHEFLLRANQVLAGASNYRETLERLAAIAVPVFGDICLIDVLAEDGSLRRMAARHADRSRQPMVDELGYHYPPDRFSSHPVVEVIRTGRSMWSPEMPAQLLRDTTRDEHHFALVSALGFQSYISVPLVAGSRILGSLTLISTDEGRRFAEKDLDLTEQLASQVAAVVDSARVHEHEHEIAHVLQRSLLPGHLPGIAGIAAAARYLPGTDGAEVGGDWYDVVPLALGRAGMVVGDVEGHDVMAASIMGQLRNALRAYALEGHGPADALGRLSAFSRDLDLDRMATVVHSVLEPATGEFRIAMAGHPPPILVPAEGPPRLLPVAPGPPLGVGATGYEEGTVQLGPGDTLVLYTDGLVEDRRVGIEAGIQRVLEAVDRVPTDPAVLCATLERLAEREGGRDDDIAVLAVQRLGPGPSLNC